MICNVYGVAKLDETMKNVDSIYRWHVIYTIANHEKKVHEFLSSNGIESFLPTEKKIVLREDRKKEIDVPLFRSYIFVRVSCREYFIALSHSSSLKYVCFEGKAAQISDSTIASLRHVTQELLEFEVSSRRFEKGEKVKIKLGSCSEYDAEVIYDSGKGKILLRIESIGYSILLNSNECNLIITN